MWSFSRVIFRFFTSCILYTVFESRYVETSLGPWPGILQEKSPCRGRRKPTEFLGPFGVVCTVRWLVKSFYRRLQCSVTNGTTALSVLLRVVRAATNLRLGTDLQRPFPFSVWRWHGLTAMTIQGTAKKWTPKVFRRFLSNRLGF